MFLAHFGVALAAKKLAPRPSLGTLVLAAQLPDLIWPVLVLAGVETLRIAPGITAASPLDFVAYPLSHSLALDLLWALAFAALYAWRTGDRAGAPWLAALVLSHWLLDAVSHRPDVPLWPGGAKVGLGLWNSVPATVVVEGALLVGGAWVYANATRARDGRGRWLLAAFVGALASIYVASLLGPPPPSADAVAWTALLGWLFVGWGYRIDRHREPVGEPATA